MRWERATPVALMGCVIDKKSATGVARSQQDHDPSVAVRRRYLPGEAGEESESRKKVGHPVGIVSVHSS